MLFTCMTTAACDKISLDFFFLFSYSLIPYKCKDFSFSWILPADYFLAKTACTLELRVAGFYLLRIARAQMFFPANHQLYFVKADELKSATKEERGRAGGENEVDFRIFEIELLK